MPKQMSIHYSDRSTYKWISDRSGMRKLIWVSSNVVSNTVTLWYIEQGFSLFFGKFFKVEHIGSAVKEL